MSPEEKKARLAIRRDKRERDEAIKKAVIIPYKKYITIDEVAIYCNASVSYLRQEFKRCGIKKTARGYYDRDVIDKWMAEVVPDIKPKI